MSAEAGSGVPTSRSLISARHIGQRVHCIEHSMQKSVWLHGTCLTVRETAGNTERQSGTRSVSANREGPGQVHRRSLRLSRWQGAVPLP